MGALPAVLGKAAVAFLTNLIMAMAGEQFIKWFFFLVANSIAKSTKTPHDDAFVKQAEKSYESYMETK